MYYQESSNQLISDKELTSRYNLRPGAHDVLLGYGFHYVQDNPPEYDWLTQKLVKGDVRKIDNSEYYEFPYTIEDLTSDETSANQAKKRQLDWVESRERRDQLLRETDWTQVGDHSLVTSDEKTAWATYRQKLRDLPETYPNSGDIEWPANPLLSEYTPESVSTPDPK